MAAVAIVVAVVEAVARAVVGFVIVIVAVVIVVIARAAVVVILVAVIPDHQHSLNLRNAQTGLNIRHGSWLSKTQIENKARLY